jgi:hypothetical protein
MEKVEEAGKKLGELVVTIGKSYLSAVVADAFGPAISDGIGGLLGDEKAVFVRDESTPKLAEDKDEKLPDAVFVEVTDAHVIEPKFGAHFLAYTTYAVRIGYLGEGADRHFYVNAQHFKIRYRQLAIAPEKVKLDHKEAKLAPLPPPYKFGGTCCFCIVQKPGDLKAHTVEVKQYFKTLHNAPFSDGLASHFRVGPSWKEQQAAKQVFFAALASVEKAEGLPTGSPSLEPFDESEAVLDLLRHYAVEKLLSEILDPIEAQDVPAMVKKNLKDAVLGALETAIETAGKGWEPAQVAANKAGAVVTKKCQEGADKIVELLKPVLAKVVGIIQEKLSKKESKEDEEKEAKKASGYYASTWKFEKTHIGKSFHGKLTTESPVDAIKHLTTEIQKSLKIAVQTPLNKATEALGALGLASNPWIHKHITVVAKKIVDYIGEVTTLDAMLDVTQKLAASVHKLEEEGAKLKKEELGKWVDKVSTTLWKDLSGEAVELYIKTISLEGKVNTLLHGDPASVKAPLVSLLGEIFAIHVKALNSVRVLYVRKLKATVHEAKDVKTASKEALRDAIFETTDILVGEHWNQALGALKVAAQAMLIAKFEEEVWGEIKEALAPIDELIPEELKSLGLSISALAFKVASLIISAGAGWAFKKIAFRLEEAVFVQEDSGEGTS